MNFYYQVQKKYAEEFEKADESILDVFVSEQTKFDTWKEMMSAAAQILIMKKLGF